MMSVGDQTTQHCSLWGLSRETSAARLHGKKTGWTPKTRVSSAAESVGVLSPDSVFLWKQKSGSQYRVRMEEDEMEC